MKSLRKYRVCMIIFVAFFVTGFLSCSKNSDSSFSTDLEVKNREPLNLKAFSFIYMGSHLESFNESPELAKRVDEGKLPPVEERLPEEPLVIPTIEKIGQYGGIWKRGFIGPIDRQNIDRIMHDHLVYYDLDGHTLMPHIAKKWDMSEDGTTFTFHLRKGMKWSDGMPFTAEDFIFAYEDLTLNAELNPAIASYMKVAGKLCRINKIDKYTVRYTFHKPNFSFIEKVASITVGGQSVRQFRCPLYAPRHYLKQFLPKYASEVELNRKIESYKMESWVALFIRMSRLHENPGLPVVGPWKTVTPITGDVFSLERNPYYFAVDTEGNQLPYIDRIEMNLVENIEVFNMRAITGAIDMQHRHVLIDKLPVLKEAAKKGNYRLLLWPGLGGSDAAIFVNQTWQGDLEIEKWLRNRDFRIALSLSIDREEINESIFLGVGEPRPFIPLPENRFYPGPEYERKYAKRDLAKANAILDRIGLEKRGKNGYRLRSDNNEPLIITLAVLSRSFLNWEGIGELVVNHFKDIGINLHLKVEERSLFSRRSHTNEQQLSLWGPAAVNPWAYPRITVPITREAHFGPKVGIWYETNGAKGVAPTGSLKRLIKVFELGNSVSLEKRVELGKELWQIHADNLFAIGIIGNSAAYNGVVVVKNNFRNVPDVAPNSPAHQSPGIARPEQFFFENN